MSGSNPFLDALLLSRRGLLTPGDVPSTGGGGDTLGDIATAILQTPDLLKARERDEEDRRFEERKRDLALKTAEFGLDTKERDLDVGDFESRKEGFLSKFGDVEGKLAEAEEAKKLDPSTPEGADVALGLEGKEADIDLTRARAEDARRPPSAGMSASRFVVLPDRITGRPEGRFDKVTGDFLPVTVDIPENVGRAVPTFALKEITSLESARGAINSVQRAITTFKEQPLVNLLEKEADLNRLFATVRSSATILGRAFGEQRLTDIDREVFSELLTPTRLRVILEEAGGPQRLQFALDEAQRSLDELQTSKRETMEKLLGVKFNVSGGDESAGVGGGGGGGSADAGGGAGFKFLGFE